MKRAPGPSELDYVLAGIARERVPGFNFPGNFLQLAYESVAKGAAHLSLDTGPHCADRDGQMNVGAVALLADMALASSFRQTLGKSTRLATVSMSLQFTGAPRIGRLSAEATCDGLIPGLAGAQGLARVEVTANGKLVCTGSGGFMPFLAQKLAHPMHVRTRAWRSPPAPAIADLTAPEAATFAHATRALRSPGPRSFIENFWGYVPRATTAGASATMPIGSHIGNRVGHAQGGITLGLATTTATAALSETGDRPRLSPNSGETGDRPRLSPETGGNGGLSPVSWVLVAVSAWYVGPGTGKSLRARSKVVHRGSLTAVVHTRIVNDEGQGVLECVTSHAKKTAAPRQPSREPGSLGALNG